MRADPTAGECRVDLAGSPVADVPQPLHLHLHLHLHAVELHHDD